MDILKSKLRKKLFAFYFTNPEKKLYVRELARILKEDPSNLAKELKKLADDKIFLFEEKGNEKYYFLNKKYPLYDEFKNIIAKTIGIEGSLRETLKQVKGIKKAFIFGSFAGKKEQVESDIDLMIIGRPDFDRLNLKISLLEDVLGREINYHVYNHEEFAKKKEKDPFIKGVLKGKKITLI